MKAFGRGIILGSVLVALEYHFILVLFNHMVSKKFSWTDADRHFSPYFSSIYLEGPLQMLLLELNN